MRVGVIILLIIYGVFWALVGAGLESHKQLRAQDIQNVQTVCDGWKSEHFDLQKCQQLQNETHLKYMCGKLGVSCWVEPK